MHSDSSSNRTVPPQAPLTFCTAVLAGLLTALAGCGGADDLPRVEVSGEVTYHGQPLVRAGRVNFIPEGDTKGPASGAELSGGKFLIPKERGPVPGKYVVRVRLNETGKSALADGTETEPLPSKDEVLTGTKEATPLADDEEQKSDGDATVSVPEFHVTVTAEGPNKFDLPVEEADE